MTRRGEFYSTESLPPGDRAAGWTTVISETYFPLHLRFRDPDRFRGRLSRRPVGAVSLSRLRTAPAEYERRRPDIPAGAEEFLVTLPLKSPVRFTQLGREVTCAPGGFLLERADEPYRFSYDDPNDLFVLKVARSVLAERIGQPDRFCARIFDGRTGVGGLFSGMVRQADATDPEDDRGRAVLGRQLVELLALALDRQAEVGPGPDSPVRAAHLRRAQDVIRQNMADPGLSPQRVADALGISKRYLHLLFAGAGLSVQQYLRDQRLIAARDMLDLPGDRSIADIAYRFGFSDQAQFARLFRAAFGESPSGYRARARQHAAG